MNESNRDGSSSSNDDVDREESVPQSRGEDEIDLQPRLNSDVMLKILSNISNFKNRNKMELVSKHFRKLVKLSKCVMPKNSNTLKLSFIRTSVVLAFGSYVKRVPCLTTTTDRKKHKQHEGLFEALDHLLIAKRNVEKVVLGGWMNESLENIQTDVVITRDLFEYLENFKNLNSLTLQSKQVTSHAQYYLKSSQCKFKFAIKTLEFRGMRTALWMKFLMNEQLEHLKLGNLQFKQPNLFIDRLEELEKHLESITLIIEQCDDVSVAERVITTFSTMCDKMNLKFSKSWEAGPEVFILAEKILLWSNITSLTLRKGFANYSYVEEIFENIKYLEYLESLEIHEIFTSHYEALGTGLSELCCLKILYIKHKDYQMTAKIMMGFVKSLPTTIETLTLECVQFDRESLDLFCSIQNKSLKKLNISSTVGELESILYLFKNVVSKIRSLEELEFNTVVPWMVLGTVVESTHLHKLAIQVTERITPSAENVIRSHFINYRKIQKRGYVLMQLENRRQCTLPFPDVLIDAATERECNRRYSTSSCD